jgi:UDP-3-O-[3-hydroxymyristoyl] N-acetylglucosamine deacetylase
VCTKLALGDAAVSTVEHLLSALEASGVDNARIEVEEGTELPILDGSAEGWVLGIKDSGVVEAQSAAGETLARKAWRPKEPIVVSSGESFVMLHPEGKTRLTYIVDFTAKTKAIGKQSFSWCPADDLPYGHEIANARTFTTLEDAEAARAAGLIKGGSPVNALIADRSMYQNGPLRYYDEPVRHKMLDLIGDLALAAGDGNAGLPIGHVVAYKASHDLHVKFARKLLEACSADDQVDYSSN